MYKKNSKNISKSFAKKLISILTFTTLLFFSACGEYNVKDGITIKAVDGYIKYAAITDAKGQKATYDGKDGQYTFKNNPVYPLTLTGGKLSDTNQAFDINMSSRDGLVISPITTFINADRELRKKLTNYGFTYLKDIKGFSVDYVATSNTDLAKLSQILYVILKDENVTKAFKKDLKDSNNTKYDSMDKLFDMANDMMEHSELSYNVKKASKKLLDDIKSYDGAAEFIEIHIEDTKKELGKITGGGTSGQTTAEKAMDKIAAYADDNKQQAPSVQDYIDAGVTGVNVANLDTVNIAVDAKDIIGVNTVAKIQAIVAIIVKKIAMDKITAFADDNTQPEPSVQDYTDVGVTGVNANNLNAVNVAVDATDNAGVNTVAKIQAIIAIIVKTIAMDKIKAYADDNTQPEPSVQDYTDAGVTGVNDNNLDAVNVEVDATDNAGVDTVAKIQAIVAQVAAMVKRQIMNKIALYADDNTKPKPTVQDYLDAGITGVDATNLNVVNAKISVAGTAGVDTEAKIQALIDNDPLPAGMTIAKNEITAYILSMYDNTQDIQGEINTKGLIVKVPYSATSDVTLLAYTSDSSTITSAHTQDNDVRITTTLQWATQNITAGSGTFDAKITINDSLATAPDGIYYAKKLTFDENNQSGLEVATFKYARNDNNSNLGTLKLKIIAGILDRNFHKQTNGKYKHRFVYLPVTNPDTGKTWLNNNLGAEYADATNLNGNFDPFQQATALSDYKAYGSLFQWGRKADGHELIKWTSASTAPTTKVTDIKSDAPTHSLLISDSKDPGDWRVNSDDTLWESEAGPNNVCPAGYRLPTAGANGDNKEWEVEVDSWNADSGHSSTTGFDSIAHTLKLSLSGYHSSADGKVYNNRAAGNYWSANDYTSGGYARNLFIEHSTSGDKINSAEYFDRYYAFAVRCIKN